MSAGGAALSVIAKVLSTLREAAGVSRSTKRGARLQLSAHFTLMHAARSVTLRCNDFRVRWTE